MKTTRIILALAAVLSLGLAAFANVHANATQSTVKASAESTTDVAFVAPPVAPGVNCYGESS
ncbi:MAG TPA: hypothetical protein VGP21_07650 [Opitutaceae bacterium]|nr:hypothetical protein [Opitutaceae bacterium]